MVNKSKSIIIIGICLVVVLLSSAILLMNGKDEMSSSENEENQAEQEINNSFPSQGIEKISLSTLGMHNTKEDCWIGFEGKVFDVTSWLPIHPGGSLVIARYCGTSSEFEKSFIAKHAKTKVEKLNSIGIYRGELI